MSRLNENFRIYFLCNFRIPNNDGKFNSFPAVYYTRNSSLCEVCYLIFNLWLTVFCLNCTDGIPGQFVL